MTTISREQVEHIAELARLALSEEEIAMYAEQLSDILAYVEQLSGLDTSAVAPTASVLPLATVLRDDIPQPSLSPEEALANAADAAAQQFRVSAVLENGEG
ncbi:MAG: Asp-tRNA(Asn)/Glu-tRNA(Gln) amidotransferase subunit GatC [Anaerolineae bacterium]